MYFHHLHFYVEDTSFWQRWFGHKLAFVSVAGSPESSHNTQVLRQGSIEIRLSSPTAASLAYTDRETDAGANHTKISNEVAAYLRQHPPGLADVALATETFSATLSHALQQGARLLRPVSKNKAGQRQCQLQGWKHLRHTLIEVSPQWVSNYQKQQSEDNPWLQAIDHVVVNVVQGELAAAVSWYQNVFGLQKAQNFEINTARSGLRSQVLVHPSGALQLPINEPTSANSQIQEFLDHNRGMGVQHVALRSRNAVGAIAHFKQQGLNLIDVPDTYYQDLSQRSDCPLVDLSDIQRQRLLIDWPQGGEQGMLLQTFTQPVFDEPTFFFEVIERQTYQADGRTQRTQGFGEGNFQALFEAIERSQMERSS